MYEGKSLTVTHLAGVFIIFFAVSFVVLALALAKGARAKGVTPRASSRKAGDEVAAAPTVLDSSAHSTRWTPEETAHALDALAARLRAVTAVPVAE